MNSMEAWQESRYKENVIIALKKSISSEMNIHAKKYHVASFRPYCNKTVDR